MPRPIASRADADSARWRAERLQSQAPGCGAEAARWPSRKDCSRLGSTWAAVSKFIGRRHEVAVFFLDLAKKIMQFRGVLLFQKIMNQLPRIRQPSVRT